MNQFPTKIASVFGIGFIGKAPGTVASLYTAAAIFLVQYHTGLWGVMAIFAAAVLSCLWACDKILAQNPSQTDPGWIVMDEVAGQTLAMIYIFESGNLWYAAIAFVAFRFFDIVKPWPISWADRKIGGSLGILLDDIIAGLMAGIVVLAAQIWIQL